VFLLPNDSRFRTSYVPPDVAIHGLRHNVFAAGADKFGIPFDEFGKRLFDSNLQVDSFGFGCWWLEERHDGSPFWGLEDSSLGPSQRRRQDLHEEVLRARKQERSKVGRERPWKGGVAPGQNMVFAAAKKQDLQRATARRFSGMHRRGA